MWFSVSVVGKSKSRACNSNMGVEAGTKVSDFSDFFQRSIVTACKDVAARIITDVGKARPEVAGVKVRAINRKPDQKLARLSYLGHFSIWALQNLSDPPQPF